MVLIDQDSSGRRVTNSPTESEWFGRFVRGCKLRMGQISKSDLAMSLDTVLVYMSKVEARVRGAMDDEERRLWVSVGAYSIVCYVGSLRGNEGFLLDLYGLRLYLDEGREPNSKPHVVVPLLGTIQERAGRAVSSHPDGCGNRQWSEPAEVA